MTIRDVAEKTGLSHQAIYKRIKVNGFKIDGLKDKQTGHFTAEGETIIRDLFNLDTVEADNGLTRLQRLTNEVAELTAENEKLTSRVDALRIQVDALTGERDYLRQTLEREQQLHGIALSKVPAALPETTETGKKSSWWARIRHKGEQKNQA